MTENVLKDNFKGATFVSDISHQSSPPKPYNSMYQRQHTITQTDNEFVLTNGKIKSRAQHNLHKV